MRLIARHSFAATTLCIHEEIKKTHTWRRRLN